MLKQPTPPIPGMTDTLEFVKNLWSGMNLPGVGVPGMPEATLSTDDLDKKIADLKAIEAWLNMNTTMLRGTIQALEVQRGTLAALKSMSESMAQAMGQAGETAAAAASMNPFFAAAGAASQQKPASGTGSGIQGDASAPGQGAEPPPGMAGIPAAMAWWNMLQDQFTHAVTNAMSSDMMANAAAMAKAATGAPADAAKPGASGAGKPDNAAPKDAKPGTSKG